MMLQSPPLENGDRLTRSQFEQRYHAMPHNNAELIEGVVYHKASPLQYDAHVKPYDNGMVVCLLDCNRRR